MILRSFIYIISDIINDVIVKNSLINTFCIAVMIRILIVTALRTPQYRFMKKFNPKEKNWERQSLISSKGSEEFEDIHTRLAGLYPPIADDLYVSRRSEKTSAN